MALCNNSNLHPHRMLLLLSLLLLSCRSLLFRRPLPFLLLLHALILTAVVGCSNACRA
jgi:hypothetical protein